MSELIVEIVKIDKVLNHKNADKMDIAIIKGWQVCVSRNGYKNGDVGAYIPIDSLIPLDVAKKLNIDTYLSISKDHPDFGRVRAINLRGEPSYGIFIPIKAIEEYFKDDSVDLNIGRDILSNLRIEKWEPPLKLNSLECEVDHPLFEKYTDIKNFRNFPDLITSNDDVIITEKIHGTNTRYGLIDNIFLVGSHNKRLKENNNNKYWYMFNDNMKNMLKKICLEKNSNCVIMYGEIYGAGIQKGFLYDSNGKLNYRCFDISVDNKFISFDEFEKYCTEFEIQTVPILYSGKFNFDQIKNTYSTAKTTLSDKNMMEGVVIKVNPEQIRFFSGGFKRTILKYVFDQYLTRKDGTEYH